MLKTLDRFKIGERGIVLKVNAGSDIKRVIFDMGITPGAEIILRKYAPFGDPIEISLRNYELSIRKVDASKVVLEVEEDSGVKRR